MSAISGSRAPRSQRQCGDLRRPRRRRGVRRRHAQPVGDDLRAGSYARRADTVHDPGRPVMINGVPTYQVVQNGQVDPATGTDVSRRPRHDRREGICRFRRTQLSDHQPAEGNRGERALRGSGPITCRSRAGRSTAFRSTRSRRPPPIPSPTSPGDPYQTVASGSLKEKPFNPKAGISWQASDHNLFYANVAKGYRAGNINSPSAQTCANDIAALGQPTPLTYKADSVTSYELGTKVRLFGGRLSMKRRRLLHRLEGPAAHRDAALQLPICHQRQGRGFPGFRHPGAGEPAARAHPQLCGGLYRRALYP